MKEVIILKGLPASGKSTYAKELVKTKHFRRVNRDDLRSMINCSIFSKPEEKLIRKTRDFIIEQSLENGKSVVIDDTNILDRGGNVTQIKEIASKFKNVKVTVNDSFCDVDAEECIRRDAIRENPVGEDVIRKMDEELKREKKMNEGVIDIRNQVKYNPNLKDCIICDLDGTLSLMDGRSPYDFKACIDDQLNEPVAKMIEDQHKLGTTVFLFSGRSDIAREETINWLSKYKINYHCLKMRKGGDFRKDDIIKEEFYNELVKDKFNVKFVLDDRNIVVDKWRELGLLTLQVWEGNF